MIGHYDWRGGREALLRFGPETGPVVIAALPLFEEANRTRALMASILRALAARGIAGVLPDMPGQGESLAPLESVTLFDMQEAFEALADTFWNAGRPAYSVSIRSSALLDPLALLHGRWRLSPQDGRTLLRELKRLKQAGDNVKLDELWFHAGPEGEPIEVAGNRLNPDLLQALVATDPFAVENGPPIRTVRLDSDLQPADRKLPGRPLWRGAEPDNDPALAQMLADDIADWIRTCVG